MITEHIVTVQCTPSKSDILNHVAIKFYYVFFGRTNRLMHNFSYLFEDSLEEVGVRGEVHTIRSC